MTNPSLSKNQLSNKICSIANCSNNTNLVKGVCRIHYSKLWRQNRDIESIPICTIEGCVRKQSARKYCTAHHSRFLKYGDPLVLKNHPALHKVVYAILNTLDGTQYIGSTKRWKRRQYRHKLELNLNEHYNINLQQAWNNFGEKVFSFIILEEIENESELLVREQWWLDNTAQKYNICLFAGTTKGHIKSQSTREKLRTAKIKTATPEYRKRLSESLKQWYLKGNVSPVCKPIIQLTLDNGFIREWGSARMAARELGGNPSSLTRCLKGKNKTSNGFKWRYKDA